jgi:hypothetical protein
MVDTILLYGLTGAVIFIIGRHLYRSYKGIGGGCGCGDSDGGCPVSKSCNVDKKQGQSVETKF